MFEGYGTDSVVQKKKGRNSIGLLDQIGVNSHPEAMNGLIRRKQC